jgi:hypothetical protein
MLYPFRNEYIHPRPVACFASRWIEQVIRLLQRVVSVILEGILLRLLDCNNIGADNLFFTQELRYHYIL